MSLTKDARLSLMIRPGNITKTVTNFDGSAADDELLLCVASLKWGLLTWPLTAIGDSEMILCPDGALSWKFLTRFDMFKTCEAEPTLLDGTGIKLDLVGDWEAPLQTCMRSSTDLVFRDLVYLASMLGIERASSYSRLDLVTMIATQVGGEDFGKVARAKEETKINKTNDEDNPDDDLEELDHLAELVLDELDKEDLDDFKDLKKRVNNRASETKKRKWKQAWDEVT